MTDQLKQMLEGRTPGLMDASGRYAVLVPLVEREDGLYLLYEVRARSMRRQPGEVCFPGGHMEGEESPEECALRETEEELNIPASQVEVLGQLDFIAHRSNFIMYPVLVKVKGEALEKMKLNPEEVDEVLLVPLSHLLETEPQEYTYKLIPQTAEDFPFEVIGIPRNYNWRQGRENGPIYPWEGHAIWGLTGKITRHLVRLIKNGAF